MKNTSVFLSLLIDGRRSNLPLTIAVLSAASLLMGFLFTDSVDEMVAYLLVTSAAAAPAVMWIRGGGGGIPVLPAVSTLYLIYYAVPILRKNVGMMDFGSQEILSAAVSVFLFLLAATLAWWLVHFGARQRPRVAGPDLISETQMQRIMFFGLAFGNVYLIALYPGLLSGLGSFFGVVRSAALTTATVACFMLGHARAQGWLRGQKWALTVAGLGLMVVLSWLSLFLVGGVMFCISALLGYVITSKRIPWLVLSAAAVALIVLHAGKDEMRRKYWQEGRSSEMSILGAPGRMAEWIGAGMTAITSGDYYDSAIDRASLLYLLMRVQRLTPDYVPMLEGKSYAVLPDMLVPRFLDPDKIASQAAMNMLNVHFGFQTVEGTQKTAVGWGLIAEGYANFGRVGVIGIGVVLGLLCGFVERWSAGAALISLPSFVAVVLLMQLINLEGDVAALATSLAQSVLAIAGYFWISGALSKSRKPVPRRVPMLR
jgi:hypothetical protein